MFLCCQIIISLFYYSTGSSLTLRQNHVNNLNDFVKPKQKGTFSFWFEYDTICLQALFIYGTFAISFDFRSLNVALDSRIYMLKVDDIRIKELNPAAEKGDLELVQKVISQYKDIGLSVAPNALTIVKTITSGNIELLKYFENNFPISPAHLSPDQINEAIRNIKSHAMFKHLLTNYGRGMRFNLNAKTTEIVARSGNLENLKLLLSVRIPPADSVTLYGAVAAGKMDCVRFLVEEYKIDGNVVITDYSEALELAETKGLQEIATYLREKKSN